MRELPGAAEDGKAGPPARRSGLARSRAPVSVLESNDIVELGGRNLDDVDVCQRHHAVHGARRTVVRVASLHSDDLELGILPDFEAQLPCLDEEGLVLLDVVLP